MINDADFPGGIWAVDFEFHPAYGQEGDAPLPVCMVAKELVSGRVIRLWQNELDSLGAPPFPTDESALIVAFYASAELTCFLALGWSAPRNILDLYAEFRVTTNGLSLIAGRGLLGALTYYGVPGIQDSEKAEMRELILSRGPWTHQQQRAILEYCESDVVGLAALFSRMRKSIDWPRAGLRGQYTAAVADMEFRGIPVDKDCLNELLSRWGHIQNQLILEVDRDYGVYDGLTFSAARFADYLYRQGIPWPTLASGALDLKDDTFRDMARAYPEITALRELRSTLGQMRLAKLSVGVDGRNRCLLSPFQSKTGRNQPSTSRFIFGPAVWMRGLIKPPAGYAMAYIDWCQQEFGIAAALSDDTAMKEAYASGDPYLAFAKQAGAVPADATKKTHKFEREQFKACVLAVQYGMGAESLALRINQPVARAHQLLELHRQTYRSFWAFSERVVNQANLGGFLWTPYGWQLHVTSEAGERSLRNWPMQSTGAEMLRIACVFLHKAGIEVCAPVHDAILIQAPAGEIEAVIARAQDLMRKASSDVLAGFELNTDIAVFKHPDRYMDERGLEMWTHLMRLLGWSSS